MTLRMRGRLRKTALLVAAPLMTIATLFGLSIAPASAYVVSNSCSNTFVCFYVDQNRMPTNAILNINGVQSNWSLIPNTGGVCGSHWNDCATSYWSRRSSQIFVWRDAGCTGNRLTIPGGSSINNLETISWSDAISSDNLNGNQVC